MCLLEVLKKFNVHFRDNELCLSVLNKVHLMEYGFVELKKKEMG